MQLSVCCPEIIRWDTPVAAGLFCKASRADVVYKESVKLLDLLQSQSIRIQHQFCTGTDHSQDASVQKEQHQRTFGILGIAALGL